MLAICGEVVATVATTFRSRMQVYDRHDSALPVLRSAYQVCTGVQSLRSPNAGQSGSFLTIWFATFRDRALPAARDLHEGLFAGINSKLRCKLAYSSAPA